MEINALSPLLYVFPQISTLVVHFFLSVYHTQTLEEGMEIAVVIERK